MVGRDLQISTSSRIILPSDIEQWRDDWTERRGGPPRILHIGNIANNAYNNAKLLIKAGFLCDVICYDYYHIMGCPEWEDADFSGDIKDHFKPDWTAVDAPGYSRPKWFAQGPQKLCLDYLIARRSGRVLRAGHIWRLMARLNGTRSGNITDLNFQSWKLRFLGRQVIIALVSPPRFLYRILEIIDERQRDLTVWARSKMERADVEDGPRLLSRLTSYCVWRLFGSIRFATVGLINIYKGVEPRFLCRLLEVVDRSERNRITRIQRIRKHESNQAALDRAGLLWPIIGICAHGLYRSIRFAIEGLIRIYKAVEPKLLYPFLEMFEQMDQSRNGMTEPRRQWPATYFCIRGCFSMLRLAIAGSIYISRGTARLMFTMVRKARRIRMRHSIPDGPALEAQLFKRIASLYRRAFPDREDSLRTDDIIALTYILPKWIELFEHYDVILAYSTDPIWPLLADKKYFALEHGTLRDIPFKKDRQGRLTSLSYHYTEHAFVTNFDCLPNAKTLCGDRYSFINHPYDEDHGLSICGVEDLRTQLRASLNADFLVFFPTRQDWVPNSGFADKANDIFIRAFCRLRAQGHRIGMVCCDWGENVRQTRRLLADNGCSDCVAWEEPMGIIRFERMSRACNLVADQFKLGAFGGVTFKALAVGVPVCTYLDAEKLDSLYPELPPVINCRTEAEIFAELSGLIIDPERLSAIGADSRKWIKTCHSGRDVVIAQVREFMASLRGNQGVIRETCAVK